MPIDRAFVDKLLDLVLVGAMRSGPAVTHQGAA
jgi:hypothetical protein